MIEPKLEQSFTFSVDAEPLLVNFDYKSTIIKELHFSKRPRRSFTNLPMIRDIMGNFGALGRLKERLDDNTIAESDKKLISATLRAEVKFRQVLGSSSKSLPDRWPVFTDKTFALL